MGRESRWYWEDQLSEYWENGFSIQEYSELKELPYERVRGWGRVMQKARQDDALESASLELAEVASIPDIGNASGSKLTVGEVEIEVEKGFDGATLSEVLNLIGARSCSASAVR